jgi:AraC-like DNA-binding protein
VETGVSVETLAREAGLSPAHFARAFTRSVGRPPHQHLLALRLARARRLLAAADARLSDVALRTGFADQAHFTRAFRRAFGVTPRTVMRAAAASQFGTPVPDTRPASTP